VQEFKDVSRELQVFMDILEISPEDIAKTKDSTHLGYMK